jgi:hypothetical protein
VQRESDRDGVRQRYGEFFDQISAALFAADPIGIDFETNTDEYDPEASTIIPRLHECSSIRDVQVVVHEEFVAWFGLEADDRCAPIEHYAVPAVAIWELWQRHLSQQVPGELLSGIQTRGSQENAPRGMC